MHSIKNGQANLLMHIFWTEKTTITYKGIEVNTSVIPLFYLHVSTV